MKPEQLHDGPYLRILCDAESRIIGIDWKETSATMSSEEFKADLMLFATHVEMKKAPGILVDVSKFRHKMTPEVQKWRVQNISTRYNAAGVRRFAFLLPQGAQIPPMMNQSSTGENFVTRAFNRMEEAVEWLTQES